MTRDHAWHADPAVRLLAALRRAGCDVFLDDGEVYCSPPLRHVAWDGDAEAAIDEHYEDIRALLLSDRVVVH